MAEIDVVPKKSTPWGWVVAMIAIVLLVLWMTGVFSSDGTNRVSERTGGSHVAADVAQSGEPVQRRV